MANKALDLGTHEMRSLNYLNGELHFRRCRSAYLLLDDTQEYRSFLKRRKESFAQCGEQIAVLGEAAERIAATLRKPVMSLFPGGRFSDDQPVSKQIAVAMIEQLIGSADDRDAICAVTLPGVMKTGTSLEAEEKAVLLQAVSQLGYQPLLTTASRNSVLAECAGTGLTGIGISVGAATVELGIVHQGEQLAHCAVPYAGDWIDQRLARENQHFLWDADGNKFLNAGAICNWKEQFQGTLLQPANDVERQLTDVCRGMLNHLFQQAAPTLQQTMKSHSGLSSQPLPLIITGRTARLPGFRELLKQSLTDASFPIDISEIRFATDTDVTVVRGGLILTEMKPQGYTARQAA